mmetsp:Transcript_112372/g.357129  ORF Transcript_112372/g.357129 Transcript_112372/m.357129 type:complete len:441 (-) Transcript_112372:568-1890(-)
MPTTVKLTLPLPATMSAAAASASPAVASQWPAATAAAKGQPNSSRRAVSSPLPASTSNDVTRLTSPECPQMKMQAEKATASFKRPRSWVLVFGWTLAMCAGLVNVVSFRAWALYVSHMTGFTTSIGMHIEGYHQRDTEFSTLAYPSMLVVSFLFGAFTCGMLIDKNQVHLGGKSCYGLALVGNSVLLVVAVVLTDESKVATGQQQIVPACFAAIAAGLQNAMCTNHFGAVVRTTHVTGTITDIGSTLGRLAMIFLRKSCRRSRLNVVEVAEVGVDARKLLVLLPMWCSFLVGATLGAYLYTEMGVEALLVPSGFTFTIGAMYTLFRQTLKGFLKEIERERLNKDMHRMQSTLERAQGLLREFNQARKIRRQCAGDAANGGDTDDVEEESMVIELEEELEDMLERMHDVEEAIGSICKNPMPPTQTPFAPTLLPRSATASF